jgi:hypothetical protein
VVNSFPLDAGELGPLLPDDARFDEGFEFEVGELRTVAVDGFPLDTCAVDGFPLERGELGPLLPDDAGFEEGCEFEVGELGTGAVEGFPLETVAIDGFPLEMVDPFLEEGELDSGVDDF